MTERWLDHPTLPGIAVSSEGAVRKDGVPVKVYLNSKGYERINARNKALSPHVLVLETFVGPRPAGHEGDHINGNCRDNCLQNLRWLPRRENRSKWGRANPAAKLNEGDVVVIRALSAAGRTAVDISSRFPTMDVSTIRQVIRRCTWKHV